MHNGSTFIGLLKELSREAKTFARGELQLAKTEILEKISNFGKDAAKIAIGGFVGYAGFIIFLGGLGVLLAFVFQRLGLHPLLAAFLGLGIIGLLISAVGIMMLFAGISALKKETLAPQKTIATLRQFAGTQSVPQTEPAAKSPPEKRTSEELAASVRASENEMAETLQQLKDRVTFSHTRIKATQELRSHPYRWGLVALCAGMCGSYMLQRRLAGRKSG